MGIELSCATAEDTRALGEVVAELLSAGDLVSLTGEPGAGKTTFVQGVGRGLGVADPVVSPTFTLIREYAGRLPIYHLDVYRLSKIQDVIDLGFEEMVDAEGVTLIEWGSAIEGLLREDFLRVDLTVPGEGEERRVRLSPSGLAWGGREGRLRELTARWTA